MKKYLILTLILALLLAIIPLAALALRQTRPAETVSAAETVAVPAAYDAAS